MQPSDRMESEITESKKGFEDRTGSGDPAQASARQLALVYTQPASFTLFSVCSSLCSPPIRFPQIFFHGFAGFYQFLLPWSPPNSSSPPTLQSYQLQWSD